MLIKATFVGKDSLGYKSGHSYLLILQESRVYNHVWIQRKDDLGGLCEYGSFIAFLNNWENLTVIK